MMMSLRRTRTDLGELSCSSSTCKSIRKEPAGLSRDALKGTKDDFY